MKTLLVSLIPLVVVAAAALVGCDDPAASTTAGRVPDNGAQFRKGEGLTLTDEMARAIGLTVAEVKDEQVAPVFTVSIQATSGGSELSGWLSAEQAARVKPGMEVTLDTAVPAKGSVSRVEQALYATSGEFEIEVRAAVLLEEGAAVKATFHFPAGEATTAVPRTALLTTAEGHFVYAKNGRFFVRTAVTIGAMNADHVEITDGLYQGDEIVTAPVKSLWLAELQVLRGGKPCTCGI